MPVHIATQITSEKQRQGNTGANLKVDYTWNNGNQMTLRTSQRGVSTGYSYDGWGRLDLVDYSDTTPDVKFEYFTHSGLMQSIRQT